MEAKIELKHPQGKKAVTMEAEKYNTLKAAIINCLKMKPELSHKELKQAVATYLEKNKIQFIGSVPWHLEWVKLDMEARKEIKRVIAKAKIMYTL